MDAKQQFDSKLIECLYAKHHEELLRFLVGLLGDRHSAADALQLCFLKLVESGEQLEPEKLRAWLYKVAYNEAMQIRRRHGVQRRSLGQLIDRKIAAGQLPGGVRGLAEDATASSASSASSNLPTAQAAAEQEVRLDREDLVRQAMETLTVDQRDVVDRRIYREQKFAEIAKELGLPLGTVLTRMRTALGRLKEFVDRQSGPKN